MSDAAWATIGGVAVALITTILAPWFVARVVKGIESRAEARSADLFRKIDETHQSVTQNSNTDDPVTMRDEIHWLMKHAREADARLADGTLRFQRLERTIGLPSWDTDPAA